MYIYECPQCRQGVNYRKDSSYYYAKKVKLICKSCKIKNKELLIVGLVRECPKCGETVNYKSIKQYNQAVKKNSKCLSCAKRMRKVPETISEHKSLSTETKIQIKHLFSTDGLSFRKIAAFLNISRNTVSKYIKETFPEYKNVKRTTFEELNVVCIRCKESKSIKKYQYGRKGNKYQYRFLFCNECRSAAIRARDTKNIDNYMKHCFQRIRKKCKARVLEFNLTTQFLIDVFTKQQGKCFYTDLELTFGLGRGLKNNQISVDRVDCSKGYTTDNVVLCSSRINSIKSNLTFSELKQWMPFWYYRLKKAGFIA